jgi:hypothetical protein
MSKKKTKKVAKRTKRSSKRSSKKTGGNVYSRLREQYENAKNRGGEDYWRPPMGRSVIRPLVFQDEAGEDTLAVKDTRWWGLDGNNKTNLRCPDKWEDDPVAQLKEYLEEEDWDTLRSKRRTQWLLNVIVISEGKNDVHEWKIARMPVTVYRELLDLIAGEKSEMCPDALHPTKGYDFRIVRSGEKLETRYTVIPTKRDKKKEKKVPSVETVNLYERLPELKLEALGEMAEVLAEEYGIEEEDE